MKLVARAKALAVATKAAAGAINDKARIPILSAVLIDATDYNLQFVGTDFDVAIAATGARYRHQSLDGAAVAGEALSKLLAGIAPDAEVTIETIEFCITDQRRTCALQTAGTAGGRFSRGAGDVVDRRNGVEPAMRRSTYSEPSLSPPISKMPVTIFRAFIYTSEVAAISAASQLMVTAWH